jgi:hypothetical protein
MEDLNPLSYKYDKHWMSGLEKIGYKSENLTHLTLASFEFPLLMFLRPGGARLIGPNNRQ